MRLAIHLNKVPIEKYLFVREDFEFVLIYAPSSARHKSSVIHSCSSRIVQLFVFVSSRGYYRFENGKELILEDPIIDFGKFNLFTVCIWMQFYNHKDFGNVFACVISVYWLISSFAIPKFLFRHVMIINVSVRLASISKTLLLAHSRPGGVYSKLFVMAVLLLRVSCSCRCTAVKEEITNEQ
uniref:Uncharacterized protein n=1 Tax=Strigamia maritima TaxID=126957 RepID=T1J209_STRMM